MSFPKCILTFFTKTLPHALGDFFKAAKEDGAKIAMAITEGVQTAIKSGVLDDVAKIIEAIFPNVKNIPEDLLAQIKDLVPKVMAAELSLQGLPTNATEEQIEKFAGDIMAAMGAQPSHSKLWSTLAGSLYSLLRAYTGQSSMTWYELLREVEEVFQAYKNHEADENSAEQE